MRRYPSDKQPIYAIGIRTFAFLLADMFLLGFVLTCTIVCYIEDRPQAPGFGLMFLIWFYVALATFKRSVIRIA